MERAAGAVFLRRISLERTVLEVGRGAIPISAPVSRPHLETRGTWAPRQRRGGRCRNPTWENRGGEAPRTHSMGEQGSLAVAYPKFVWANNSRVFPTALTGVQSGDSVGML